jgi:SAM-dependent methyltransferase
MTAPATAYDSKFFNSISAGSSRSAQRLLPLVIGALAPRSVLDVGCGRGAWLAEFMRLGVGDAMGVDGDYVKPETLAIPATQYTARDITQPFDLGRQFDLAICLEVGEHIPNAASAALVANIVRHAPMVLFSAAVPGQGGQDHINEMPLDFWRELFMADGYDAFDPFRRVLRGQREVEPWYRNNVLLYVRSDAAARLPDAVRATAVAPGSPIADLSSPLFQLRKAVLRRLPRSVVNAMARAKHTIRGGLRAAN